jgi:hypothetical protein
VTITELRRRLLERLRRRQSEKTGGWANKGDQLAVEPTVLALFALSDSDDGRVVSTGIQALWKTQRCDGQWPMIASHDDGSPWATALAAAAFVHLCSPDKALERALISLVRSEPTEAFWLWRLKFRTTDTHVGFDPNKYGWGWVPGTVSWVIPTAMAVIALERSRPLSLVPSNELTRRVDLGHAMLLDRMCPGGGWNAGNSVVYGVPLTPHIDATSFAIAALRFHYHLPEVRQSLSWLLGANSARRPTAWRGRSSHSKATWKSGPMWARHSQRLETSSPHSCKSRRK